MAIDISSTTRRIVYTGSSGVGPYSFAFEVLAETDIAVYFNTTELTLTTDYTVSLDVDGTGSVTIVTGSSVPSTPTASDRITIVGDRTIQRTTDFTTGGPLFATSLNDEFDSQTIFVQQVLEQSDRSLRAPNTDPTTVNMVLPINTVRANKTLAFDANGDPVIGEQIGDNRGNWAASTVYNKRDLVKDTSNNNIYLCNTAHTSSGSQPLSTNTDAAKWDLIVDAASAAASATAAAASASAAATSETNAATSATSASTSATTATTKASEASTSASNASTSETNAASSATSAASSASTATTKASEASTSASNAATSETNAASSASTASSAATTATTQASNASTSATNAATSETNAATSASTASTAATNAATSASAAATSATAAQTAAESIDAFYLGALSSDPTVDGNGDPVTAGDWYFNTTSNETRIYNGSTWQVTAISTSGFLTAGDIGSTVQAYDADTAKLDVVQTFTANQTFADGVRAYFGTGPDFSIFHDGNNTYLTEFGDGTGNTYLRANNLQLLNNANEIYVNCTSNGTVGLYYDNAIKLGTTSIGIDVTGTVATDRATGTVTTDNDLSFDLSATNNFSCTPTVGAALTFTNHTAGQSGYILLDNSAGVAITAAATTKITATDLTTISTAGVYLVSYFDNGTNAYVTVSASYS